MKFVVNSSKQCLLFYSNTYPWNPFILIDDLMWPSSQSKLIDFDKVYWINVAPVTFSTKQKSGWPCGQDEQRQLIIIIYLDPVSLISSMTDPFRTFRENLLLVTCNNRISFPSSLTCQEQFCYGRPTGLEGGGRRRRWWGYEEYNKTTVHHKCLHFKHCHQWRILWMEISN